VKQRRQIISPTTPDPLCEGEGTYSPAANTKCEGVNFIQREDKCHKTKLVEGTKDCSPKHCDQIPKPSDCITCEGGIFLPAANTKCEGVLFTQTNNECGNTKQVEGTKDCSPKHCDQNPTAPECTDDDITIVDDGSDDDSNP